MNYKTTASLLCALALGAISAQAQTPAAAPVAAAPSYTITATTSVVSQYMFRGTRLGGPSIQPAVDFASGSLALGLWTNFPVKDKVVGASDPELDFYGSYTFDLVKDSLNIVPGFTLYDYPNAYTNAGAYRSTFEPSVALNYTIAGVKFTPKAYYDFMLKGPTYELSAAYALPLKDLGTELDFLGTVGTLYLRDAANNATPRVKNWGDYWSLGVAAPFQLTKESKLSVGFAYTKGSGNYLKAGSTPKFSNPSAVGRGVVTISYSYGF